MSWAIFSRPFLWYNDILIKYPLLTKSVTSGIMYAGGDVLAQYAEAYSKGEKWASVRLDKKRVGIFFVFGTVFSGPVYHYWFNYLNELPAVLWQIKQMKHRGKILRAYALLKSHGIEVKLDLSKLPNAAPLDKWKGKAAKIAADQLIFSSLYTLIFFLTIGMMEGAATKLQLYLKAPPEKLVGSDAKIEDVISQIKKQVQESPRTQKEEEQNRLISDLIRLINESKDKESHSHEIKVRQHYEWDRIWQRTWTHTKEVYWTTYFTDCLVWPPLQLINFTFVPLRFQFLFVNVANLAWNTFLSLMANKRDHGEQPSSHSHLSKPAS
jgi:hypothetical protein